MHARIVYKKCAIGVQVANSVSGKTDMLIAGQVLEDGRQVVDSSKYKTALEKKVTEGAGSIGRHIFLL